MVALKITVLLLISCLISAGLVTADILPVLNETAESVSSIQNEKVPEITVPVETESFFDIYFISSEKLRTILSHPGPDALVLKTDPGYKIGIITPSTLYIRSDLDETVFSFPENATITMEDISHHLIDTAFGRDNQKLTMFNSEKDYKFFFTDEYSDEDLYTVLDFARFFNDISNIVSIEDEECELSFLPGTYETAPYYYYNITIVSPLMFEEYVENKNSTDKIFRSTVGKEIEIVTSDRLILTDDLTGKERKYYILRGLLWSMGFHGETTRYRDSFFSKGLMNPNFSDIDIQALTLMYGGRLQDGMNLEATEKALNLN